MPSTGQFLGGHSYYICLWKLQQEDEIIEHLFTGKSGYDNYPYGLRAFSKARESRNNFWPSRIFFVHVAKFIPDPARDLDLDHVLARIT